MKTWIGASTILVAGVMLYSGTALGQAKPADCPKAEKVEGRIVKIDADQGKITLQGPDGKTFEFTASKDALADKKVGDRLEVARRMPEHCK